MSVRIDRELLRTPVMRPNALRSIIKETKSNKKERTRYMYNNRKNPQKRNRIVRLEISEEATEMEEKCASEVEQTSRFGFFEGAAAISSVSLVIVTLILEAQQAEEQGEQECKHVEVYVAGAKNGSAAVVQFQPFSPLIINKLAMCHVLNIAIGGLPSCIVLFGRSETKKSEQQHKTTLVKDVIVLCMLTETVMISTASVVMLYETVLSIIMLCVVVAIYQTQRTVKGSVIAAAALLTCIVISTAQLLSGEGATLTISIANLLLWSAAIMVVVENVVTSVANAAFSSASCLVFQIGLVWLLTIDCWVHNI